MAPRANWKGFPRLCLVDPAQSGLSDVTFMFTSIELAHQLCKPLGRGLHKIVLFAQSLSEFGSDAPCCGGRSQRKVVVAGSPGQVGNYDEEQCPEDAGPDAVEQLDRNEISCAPEAPIACTATPISAGPVRQFARQLHSQRAVDHADRNVLKARWRVSSGSKAPERPRQWRVRFASDLQKSS
jgi:hypothetical protein